MQALRHGLGKDPIFSGQGHRSRQTARHLEGEARTRQNAAGRITHHLGHDLVRQQAAAGLEPFADPEKGHGGCDDLDLFQQCAQTRQRRCDERQVGGTQRRLEVGRDPQCGRKGAGRQVAQIFAPARHIRDTSRVARPEAHRVPAGEGNGKRRTPGPGAEDGYSHCALSVESRET